MTVEAVLVTATDAISAAVRCSRSLDNYVSAWRA